MPTDDLHRIRDLPAYAIFERPYTTPEPCILVPSYDGSPFRATIIPTGVTIRLTGDELVHPLKRSST